MIKKIFSANYLKKYDFNGVRRPKSYGAGNEV